MKLTIKESTMKRQIISLVLGLLLVLALAACGQGDDQSAASGAEASSNSTAANSSAGDETVNTIVAQISDSFDGALSPMGQLALGTLQLEDGELAVTEEQAAELLPLWQALQSLSNSDTTAQVELDAVVKQIQGAMTAEQVATIAALKLTGDDLTAAVQNGDLGSRGFGGRNATTEGDSGFTPPEGGFVGGPGGGFGPPGGVTGEGPGGRFGGGFAGGAGGNLSEDDIATRRAEFANNSTGDMSEQFLIGAVVRLMQTKTGQAPAGPGGLFETVFSLVADETGLTVEEIQAAMANGQSLAEIIESNGGDVEAVRAAMIDAFEASPNAEGLDAAQMADQWLNQQSEQQ
jgi:hypothetical protein